MGQRRRALVLAVLSVAAVTTAACGPGAVKSDLAAEPPVTITFWHGWSQPHEVKAIQDNLARFHRLGPELRHHAGIVAIGHEADVLAIGLVGHRQPEALG